MVMMVPARSVSFSFVAALSSSLTGQCEDEAHAIYNSSRHGGCVITVSAGGEKFRLETFVSRDGGAKGGVAGFMMRRDARLGVRRAVAACVQDGEALTLGGG